jgi:hypothetical protein
VPAQANFELEVDVRVRNTLTVNLSHSSPQSTLGVVQQWLVPWTASGWLGVTVTVDTLTPQGESTDRDIPAPGSASGTVAQRALEQLLRPT